MGQPIAEIGRIGIAVRIAALGAILSLGGEAVHQTPAQKNPDSVSPTATVDIFAHIRNDFVAGANDFDHEKVRREAENYQLSPEFAAVPKPVDPFSPTAILSEIPFITPDASPQAKEDPGPPAYIFDPGSEIQCVTEFTPPTCVFFDMQAPAIHFTGEQIFGIETGKPSTIVIFHQEGIASTRLVYEIAPGKYASIDLPFTEDEIGWFKKIGVYDFPDEISVLDQNGDQLGAARNMDEKVAQYRDFISQQNV